MFLFGGEQLHLIFFFVDRLVMTFRRRRRVRKRTRLRFRALMALLFVPTLDEVLTQSGSPRHRQRQRSQQRYRHSHCQRPEEDSSYARDHDQWNKNDHGGDGRSDQWNGDFFQRTANCFQASLPRVAMQHDVLHHHDRVINHQSNGRSKSAKRHQVEGLSHHFKSDECDHDGDGYHQARDERRAPVAQEHDQNDRRQNQTQQDGVAHALNGLAHNNRLIVKGLNLNTRRQRLAQPLNFVVNFLRHLHGIAVGLPINVQQDCRLAVRRYYRVDGLHAWSDARNIPDAYWNPGRSTLDHRICDFLRRLNLAVH